MWAILKVFIEFITILLLFHIFDFLTAKYLGSYRTKRISLTREFFLFPSPCQERQKKISDWLEA